MTVAWFAADGVLKIRSDSLTTPTYLMHMNIDGESVPIEIAPSEERQFFPTELAKIQLREAGFEIGMRALELTPELVELISHLKFTSEQPDNSSIKFG